MKKIACALFVLVATYCMATYAFANCGNCGSDGKSHTHSAKGSGYEKKGSRSGSYFDEVRASTAEKGGVKEITYDQFQKIRNSGEKYVLVDVLSQESYEKGHIKGAISFPVTTIDYKRAPKMLKKTDKIIVYCGSFQCSASTGAAHRLQALGYKNVLDYKGGLKEWQEKGNTLAQ